MINNIKAEKLILNNNFKLNDINLIFSNEKNDYISFIKTISRKFDIEKIFDLNSSIKELSKQKLFDVEILKYFNATSNIINLLDINNYFNKDNINELNLRLNNYFELLLGETIDNSISIDYQINFNKNNTSKLWQKEIFFLKLLNKIIAKDNKLKPVLINVSDYLFVFKTKIRSQIISELNILSKKNNIFLFINVNSEETFRIFNNELENTYLLYRTINNEIELKRFLSEAKKESYAIKSIFPTKQNHFNRLKDILNYTKLNLISSNELIFVFNREFRHLIKNYLAKEEDVYILEDLKDSYYIADLFNQINQLYKIKFIFDKKHLEEPFFNDLSKHLSNLNIKWTYIRNIFKYDEMSLEINEIFNQEQNAYLDNIKSFIEQRSPKIVFMQEKNKKADKKEIKNQINDFQKKVNDNLSQSNNNLDNNDSDELLVQYEESTKELTIFNEEESIVFNLKNKTNSNQESTKEILIDSIENKLLNKIDFDNQLNQNKVEIIFENNQFDKKTLNIDSKIDLNLLIKNTLQKLEKEELRVIIELQKANLFEFILLEKWNKKYGNVLNWDLLSLKDIEESLYLFMKSISQTKLKVKNKKNIKKNNNNKIKKWKK